MSVIVAIKKDNVVYMGCDTQTSMGKSRKFNYLQEATFKITRMKNGVLVGICGSVTAHQALCVKESCFELEEDSLTKEYIVTKIIPKIKKYLKELELEDDKKGEMPVSILIAYKDKLFEITSHYFVIAYNDYCSIGAGYPYTYLPLTDDTLTIRERILGALRMSAKRCSSVSKPYVLIDTLNNEYEIVEE